MQLPEALESEYRDVLYEFEKGYKMPFATSFERAGEESGLQKGRPNSLIFTSLGLFDYD